MSNKVIITGSEGLIGKTVSDYLERSGYEVIRCSRSLGHDLNNEEFVKTWFSANKANHLINLFALNEHIDKEENEGPDLFSVSLKSINDFLTLNVTSLFSVCREFARNNEDGNIINFSSIYGVVSPDPALYNQNRNKHIGYVTSKSAVIQLTKYLAVHLAPRVRVNCVVPGGIKNNQDEEFIKRYSDRCPMNRMMNVSEINSVIDFLCSKNSAYCTGAQFVLDGGYTAW